MPEPTEKDRTTTNTMLTDSDVNDKNLALNCVKCNKISRSIPRVLSCLHILCEECITSTIGINLRNEKDIKCAKCYQSTRVMPGMSNLPYDHITMNLVESNTLNSTTPHCLNFNCLTKNEAVSRCNDCSTILCTECVSNHMAMNDFASHKFTSLQELKNSTEKVPIHLPIYCPKHNSNMIQSYCYSCQETLCGVCINDHNGHLHQRASLEEAKTNESNLLLNQMNMITKKNIQLCKVKQVMNDVWCDMNSEKEKVKKDINRTMETIIDILTSRKNDMLKQVEEEFEYRKNSVKNILDSGDELTKHITYVYDFMHRVIDHANSGELLSLKPVMFEQSTKLCNEQISPISFDPINVVIDTKFIENYIRNNINCTMKSNLGIARENGFYESSCSIIPNNRRFSDYSDSTNNRRISGVDGNGILDYPGVDHSGPVSSNSSCNWFSNEGYNNNTLMACPLGTGFNGSSTITTMSSLSELQMDSPRDEDYSTASNAARSADLNLPLNSFTGIDSMNMVQNSIPSINQNVLFENITKLAKMSNINGNNIPAHDHDPTVYFNTYNCNGNNTNVSFDRSNCSSISSHTITETLYSKTRVVNNGAYSNGRGNNSGRIATPLDIYVKFGQLGSGQNQFASPTGFCVGGDDSIIVADSNNHRIQVFNSHGEFCRQFGISGKLEGQLWFPRKVEILKSGSFIICDRGNERSRLQVFTQSGRFIKKMRLKFVEIVAGMTVTDDGHIVVVDSVQPTIYKLDEEGVMLKWIDCKEKMTEPSDIAVKNNKYYVCDFKGDRVCVVDESGTFLKYIGGPGITNYPNGIEVSPSGHILVGDSHGNKFHICIFDDNGLLLHDYECPYVKVSRCCGLKTTSTGCIITVAKNNNHILVLKSPFNQLPPNRY